MDDDELYLRLEACDSTMETCTVDNSSKNSEYKEVTNESSNKISHHFRLKRSVDLSVMMKSSETIELDDGRESTEMISSASRIMNNDLSIASDKNCNEPLSLSDPISPDTDSPRTRLNKINDDLTQDSLENSNLSDITPLNSNDSLKQGMLDKVSSFLDEADNGSNLPNGRSIELNDSNNASIEPLAENLLDLQSPIQEVDSLNIIESQLLSVADKSDENLQRGEQSNSCANSNYDGDLDIIYDGAVSEAKNPILMKISISTLFSEIPMCAKIIREEMYVNFAPSWLEKERQWNLKSITGKDLPPRKSRYLRVVIAGNSFVKDIYTAFILNPASKIEPYFLWDESITSKIEDVYANLHSHPFLHAVEGKILLFLFFGLNELIHFRLWKQCNTEHPQLSIPYMERNRHVTSKLLDKMLMLKNDFEVQKNLVVVFSEIPKVSIPESVFNIVSKCQAIHKGCSCQMPISKMKDKFEPQAHNLIDSLNQGMFHKSLTRFEGNKYISTSNCSVLITNEVCWGLSDLSKKSSYFINNLLERLHYYTFNSPVVAQLFLKTNDDIEDSLDKEKSRKNIKVFVIGDSWLKPIAANWPFNSDHKPLFINNDQLTLDNIKDTALSIIGTSEEALIIASIPVKEFVCIKLAIVSDCSIKKHPLIEYPSCKYQCDDSIAEMVWPRLISTINTISQARKNCKVLFTSNYPINFEDYYDHINKLHQETYQCTSQIPKSAYYKPNYSRTAMATIDEKIKILNGTKNCNTFDICEIVNQKSVMEDILYPVFIENTSPPSKLVPIITSMLLKYLCKGIVKTDVMESTAYAINTKETINKASSSSSLIPLKDTGSRTELNDKFLLMKSHQDGVDINNGVNYEERKQLTTLTFPNQLSNAPQGSSEMSTICPSQSGGLSGDPPGFFGPSSFGQSLINSNNSFYANKLKQMLFNNHSTTPNMLMSTNERRNIERPTEMGAYPTVNEAGVTSSMPHYQSYKSNESNQTTIPQSKNKKKKNKSPLPPPVIASADIGHREFRRSSHEQMGRSSERWSRDSSEDYRRERRSKKVIEISSDSDSQSRNHSRGHKSSRDNRRRNAKRKRSNETHLEALTSIKAIHLKECNIYRKYPDDHPEFKQEYIKYRRNYFDMRFDQEHWKNYWSERMEILFKQRWEVKKRQCLSLLPSLSSGSSLSGSSDSSFERHRRRRKKERNRLVNVEIKKEVITEHKVKDVESAQTASRAKNRDSSHVPYVDSEKNLPVKTNISADDLIDLLAMLCQIGEKFGVLGISLTSLSKTATDCKASGKNPLSCVNEDALMLFTLIKDKIKVMLKDQSLSIVKSVFYQEAHDKLVTFIDSSREKDSSNEVDINLIAKSTNGKSVSDILSSIKSALRSRGNECLQENVMNIYLKVKDVQVSLTETLSPCEASPPADFHSQSVQDPSLSSTATNANYYGTMFPPQDFSTSSHPRENQGQSQSYGYQTQLNHMKPGVKSMDQLVREQVPTCLSNNNLYEGNKGKSYGFQTSYNSGFSNNNRPRDDQGQSNSYASQTSSHCRQPDVNSFQQQSSSGYSNNNPSNPYNKYYKHDKGQSYSHGSKNFSRQEQPVKKSKEQWFGEFNALSYQEKMLKFCKFSELDADEKSFLMSILSSIQQSDPQLAMFINSVIYKQ